MAYVLECTREGCPERGWYSTRKEALRHEHEHEMKLYPA